MYSTSFGSRLYIFVSFLLFGGLLPLGEGGNARGDRWGIARIAMQRVQDMDAYPEKIKKSWDQIKLSR